MANCLPVIMCAGLKHRELYTFQLRTAALFRQHLEIIIVGLSQIKRIFPRTLNSTAITSAHVSNSAAMFTDR